MAYTGRKEIYTDEIEITQENIAKVLEDAFSIHRQNEAEIKYLQEYERGVQPILNRVKDVRPEINNRVVENHAAEITAFKVGYVFGSPITYVQRTSDDGTKGRADDGDIALLNDMMYEEGKVAQDQALGKDLAVCGVGYRLVLPKAEVTDSSVFDILRLNPRTTFIVRYNDVYRRKALGVSYVALSDGTLRVGAYTDSEYFELTGGITGTMKLVKVESNRIGIIPIVEYANDNEHMGCFERVLPQLDALNLATSDRLNGLEQFISSFIWFNNCELDEKQMEGLKDKMGLMTRSEPGNPVSVQYLSSELDQTQTQTFVDYLYEQILQIAGVPGREQATGGNTGQAIMLSNGWQIAETHARNLETMFTASEKEMLEIVLKIIRASYPGSMASLRLSDIDVKFSRNKTDSLLVKTQGLMNQLQAGIHPLVAITHCGLYSDPQSVWNDSRPYMGKWLYDAEEGEIDGEDTVPHSRRSGGEDNTENIAGVQA